jgi:hypothetical protein
MMRHAVAALLAALSAAASAGVIGGPADGMGPAITEHGPLVNRSLDPPLHQGWAEMRQQDTTEKPVSGSIGSFRAVCYPAWLSHNDPLKFPGRKDATHLHIGFGAALVDQNTTDPSMLAAMPSTCLGGTTNRSSYWAPALIDTRTGAPVRPALLMIYYKTGYNGIKASQVRTMPNGLRMIAGSATNAERKGPVQHRCDGDDPATGLPVPVPVGGWSQDIPNCPVGTRLITEIWFGQCLQVDADGNPVLSSPDHKSHVSSTVRPPNAAPVDPVTGKLVTQYSDGKWCPTTHPYPIPEVRAVFFYDPVTEPDQTAGYRYSSDMYYRDANGNVIPGGRSGHVDYMKWWDEAAWSSVLQMLQASKDGHAHLLGNGRKVY